MRQGGGWGQAGGIRHQLERSGAGNCAAGKGKTCAISTQSVNLVSYSTCREGRTEEGPDAALRFVAVSFDAARLRAQSSHTRCDETAKSSHRV